MYALYLSYGSHIIKLSTKSSILFRKKMSTKILLRGLAAGLGFENVARRSLPSPRFARRRNSGTWFSPKTHNIKKKDHKGLLFC
jgi:hypothetical protein